MKRRQLAFATITIVLTVMLVVLAGEGLYALAHFRRPDTSFTYRLLSYFRPAHDDPSDPDWPEITDTKQITPLLAAFKANGVALGGSPYQELRTEQAELNLGKHGCMEMKPNLHKTMSYLRSELFDNFNRIIAFYDADRPMPADVSRFLDLYAFRKIRLTSNEHGERLTLPVVQSTDKILVIGDSMGLSAGLDDSETLASQLQARDPAHQYVNMGVGGADAVDIVCELERAAKRYPGQIRGVIYPFCENDLAPKKPFGTPEQLIPRLAQFKAENHIADFTIIYMPYIYNSMPDVARTPNLAAGIAAKHLPRKWVEKKRLIKLATEAGFKAFDFTEVTDAERKAAGSQFAAFALFVDQVHLSRYGVHRLVERLLPSNG
jgi:lysophospholipase L1-like esterase